MKLINVSLMLGGLTGLLIILGCANGPTPEEEIAEIGEMYVENMTSGGIFMRSEAECLWSQFVELAGGPDAIYEKAIELQEEKITEVEFLNWMGEVYDEDDRNDPIYGMGRCVPWLR